MSASLTKPSMQGILSDMEYADNPLDFVKKNIAKFNNTHEAKVVTQEQPVQPQQTMQQTPQAQPSVEPAQVIKAVEDKRNAIPEKPKAEASKVETEVESLLSSALEKTEDKQDEVKPEGETPALPNGTTEPVEGEEDSKTINFKQLRNTIKEHKATLAAREKEAAELREKLTKFETGEEVAEPVKQKLERVSQLEHYELIHNLKGSPAYKEKFINPMKQLKEALTEYATDYEVPTSVMEDALNTTSKAELNKILSENFDTVGASEVKGLITKLQDLHNESIRAEEMPSEALKQLEEEHKVVEERRIAQAKAVMNETSKSAWVESLVKIKEEGKALELIPTETDPDRTEKFVKPILKNAATQYATIVKMLAENGLSKLPKELAFALSRACQLSCASAVAIERANALEKHANEIETNTERTTSYLRPRIGSSNGSGAEPQARKSTTPEEAANQLLKQVMSSGRR